MFVPSSFIPDLQPRSETTVDELEVTKMTSYVKMLLSVKGLSYHNI